MHFSVTDYMLDMVENSIEAGATMVTINLEESAHRILLAVADDGEGMDEATVKRAMDPFYTSGFKHPGRSVGLGLPFLSQVADQTGGNLELSSRLGQGTTVRVELPAQHPDTPPVGDVDSTFQQALCHQGDYEMVIHRRVGTSVYMVRRSQLREALGELYSAGSRQALQEFFKSQEMEAKREECHGKNDA